MLVLYVNSQTELKRTKTLHHIGMKICNTWVLIVQFSSKNAVFGHSKFTILVTTVDNILGIVQKKKERARADIGQIDQLRTQLWPPSFNPGLAR